jgi:hypothetical protein
LQLSNVYFDTAHNEYAQFFAVFGFVDFFAVAALLAARRADPGHRSDCHGLPSQGGGNMLIDIRSVGKYSPADNSLGVVALPESA